MSIKAFFAAMTLKVKVLVICAAVVVAGGTAAAVGIAVTREETYRVLKVFELTGNAVVSRADSGDLDAYVGMNLESGDTLTVGEDSTLRISLDSDKYILLDSGTVLALTATGNSTDSRTSIDLKTGTILNEITNPLSANSSYEVSTPKSTMAVRGTSFMVSVEEDSNGTFIIRDNTFQGNVEVELIDKNGKRTGNTVLVPPDNGVTVCTEPDASSGNPAEVDGTSRFVMEDMNGNISNLDEGQDPLHEIRYGLISDSVRGNALRSNDEKLMPLEDDVLNKLRGGASESSVTSETTAATVTTVTTEPETTAETTVTTEPETTTEATTVTIVMTEAETTTKATTVTTVPTETTTKATTVTTPKTTKKTTVTTVPTETETTTKTTTVTTVPTETETTTTTRITHGPSVPTGPPSGITFPTEIPTPTPVPSEDPSPVPTEIPTPSAVPTEIPTPSAVPTEIPTPSAVPTEIPTPSAVPTEIPTPSAVPTEIPTPSAVPTEIPTPSAVPTEIPTPSAVPTEIPTPSAVPTATS